MGGELRKARKSKRLTQAALGDLVGVTGSAVGQWEQGRTKPSWVQAERLADVLLDATPDEVSRLDVVESQVQLLARAVLELLAQADATPDVDELLRSIRAAFDAERDVL